MFMFVLYSEIFLVLRIKKSKIYLGFFYFISKIVILNKIIVLLLL